jgi:hypothetical protein
MFNFVIKQKNQLGIIIVIYLLTNVLLISNNGLFWDDWCLTTTESREAIITGVGNRFLIPFYNTIFRFIPNPAQFFHILTILFEIITFIFFYKILSFFKFTENTIFIATLFFALLPYNQSKISIACFSYTAGLMFFITATYLFILVYKKHDFITRLLSLILFFCSFLVLPSTLLLMLTMIMVITIFSKLNELTSYRNIFFLVYAKAIYWIDFILLPFCFWVFRSVYLLPSGIYAKSGYREFKISSILTSPLNIFTVFSKNILITPFLVIQEFAPIIAVFSTLIFIILKTINFQYDNNIDIKKSKLYLLLLIFIASILPYILLGLEPSFEGFNSRHQILLRFSGVFFILYFLQYLNSNRQIIVFISFLTSTFIFYTINTQLQFQKSWFKQIAVEKYFTSLNLNKNSMKYCIIDNTKQYNEFKQYYEPYVYSGILNKIYQSDNFVAVDIENRPFKFEENDLITKKSYHISNVNNFDFYDSIIIIKPGKILLSKVQVIKGTFYYYFNHTKFNIFIEEIINFESIEHNVINK